MTITRKKKSKWKDQGSNLTLDAKTFFISYNPNVSSPMNSLYALAGTMMGGTGLETDGAETAICSKEGYRILKGDFRKDYEKLIPKGLKACVAFFDKTVKERPALRGGWTTSGL